MKVKKTGRTTIIYWLIAIMMVAVLGIVTLREVSAVDQTDAYPVVILGDSVFGLCRDETSIAALLEKELGVPVFNGAFGGSYMALLPEKDAETNYTMELLNMVSLSKAIVSGDYGVQRTVRSRREITDYFAETIRNLSRIDFHRVDTLVISFGLNDYHAGTSVDNPENLYDETTYGGALRSVLRSIQKEYPDMRIILVTPTYAWYHSVHKTCEEYVTGEAFLEAYVEKELEIAEDFGVDVVDLYHDVYPHEQWEDWSIYTLDGLHPNEEGRKMLAGLLGDCMKNEFVTE